MQHGAGSPALHRLHVPPSDDEGPPALVPAEGAGCGCVQYLWEKGGRAGRPQNASKSCNDPIRCGKKPSGS